MRTDKRQTEYPRVVGLGIGVGVGVGGGEEGVGVGVGSVCEGVGGSDKAHISMMYIKLC